MRKKNEKKVEGETIERRRFRNGKNTELVNVENSRFSMRLSAHLMNASLLSPARPQLILRRSKYSIIVGGGTENDKCTVER